MMRVEVAAQRNRYSGVDQGAGRSIRSHGVERRAGQECGHDSRFGDLPGLECDGVLQMIDTHHIVLCSESDGGGRARTVGVDLAGETELLCGVQIAIEQGQQGRVAIPCKVRELGDTTTANLWKQFGHHPFGGMRGPSVEVVGQTEKKAGNQIKRFAAKRGQHTQQLGFGALIDSAPGFDLDGGGAVARHGFEVCARADFQPLTGGHMHGVHGRGGVRRMDPGRREGQMRMGVDEAGHYYPSGGVDLDGAPRLGEVLHAPAGPHFHQDSIANEDGAVLYHIEFVEGSPTTRFPGATHCQQMTCTPDQYGFQPSPHLTVTLVLEPPIYLHYG